MAKEKAQDASNSKGSQSFRWNGPSSQQPEINNTSLVIVANQQQFTTLINEVQTLEQSYEVFKKL